MSIDKIIFQVNFSSYGINKLDILTYRNYALLLIKGHSAPGVVPLVYAGTLQPRGSGISKGILVQLV